MREFGKLIINRKLLYSSLLLLWFSSISPVYAVTPCIDGTAQGFPCHNVELLSRVTLPQMQANQGNDLWGWTDAQTGTEYVLFGHSLGVSFVDISNPENPIYLGRLPTNSTNQNVIQSNPWRDVGVYADHAFIVSEADGHGMQIFDLTQLRGLGAGNRVFSNTSNYTGFGHAHNIAINPDSGIAYVVGSDGCRNGQSLMLNLGTPQFPVFAGPGASCIFENTYTHDAHCVNYHGPDQDHQGTEICINSNEDEVAIVDVTDKNNPVQLARLTYPVIGYTHQGWLTEDHQYFLFGDELDESNFNINTRTLILDVRNLDAPVLIGQHFGATKAIDHNLYVHDGFVFEANYSSGLSVLDTSNIANGGLTEIGFFDVYPENDAQLYTGAWSVYPFFGSGSIAVSSIDRGLFILKLGPNRTPVPGAARKADTVTPTTSAGFGSGGGAWNIFVLLFMGLFSVYRFNRK